jgi:hypothetical protein
MMDEVPDKKIVSVNFHNTLFYLLTLEDGTNRLSRNISNKITTVCCTTPQKSADLTLRNSEAGLVLNMHDLVQHLCGF